MPRIDLKTLEIDLGGRDRPDFGTVRPRVQIPGPRPKPEFRFIQAAELTRQARCLTAVVLQ
jgi:hypothetical protein